jgi:hypothetical protein
MHFFQQILNWSEVWATLIPLVVALFVKSNNIYLRPLFFYLCFALIAYLCIDLAYVNLIKNNNTIYNGLSILRLFFFIGYFALLNVPSNKKIRRLIFVVVILMEVFVILEAGFKNFNSLIFGLEAIILIIYGLLYFFKTSHSEELDDSSGSTLLVITGLLIYESCCFFIFLFYSDLAVKDVLFAVNLWNVHNVVYIVMCLYFSKAFLEFGKHESIKS